jgi:putative Holliday junction resolvase
MSSLPRQGRLLALDWGKLRFGVARSDEGQILASPLSTLSRRAGKRFPMPRFLDLVDQAGATGILVGLPLSPEGGETAASGEARALAGQVAARTGLPVELWDERFTTARALSAIREMGGSTRGRREDVDALAAAVLLQQFLDSRRERES